MKTLKEYIEESLLDIEGTIKANDEVIRQNIEKWIKDNFNVGGLKISNNPNKDGLYEVSAKNVYVKNRNITSLTNGIFVWDKINGNFNCSYCNSLTSLEGAPKEVSGEFACYNCKSLTSLEGAPKEVGCNFNCSNCPSLTSLEGAPEKVGGDFYCYQCTSLKSLEGAPKEVGGKFICNRCDSLTSLEGAPKEVGGNFNCLNCTSLKSKDLPATTKIKGEILK